VEFLYIENMAFFECLLFQTELIGPTFFPVGILEELPLETSREIIV
jgi:hypothetical protein